MAETGVKGPSGGGTSSATIGVTTQLDAGLSAWREGGLPSSGRRAPAEGGRSAADVAPC